MKYLSNVVSLVFVEEKCIGCGTCIEVCPHAVFERSEKKVRITDIDSCMECGACANNCEFYALRVNAGVGCAFAIIKSMITGGKAVCGCSDTEAGSGGGCC